VPQRRRRKRLDASTTPNPPTADAPNVVWAVDFQFDATTDSRPIKIVSILPPSSFGVLTSLSPAIAALTGWFVLHQRLAWSDYLAVRWS
jgi:hypothetical protein